MIEGICIAILLAILALFFTYDKTKNKYLDKHKNEMTACKKEYDRKISQLEATLKKSSTDFKSLQTQYEEFLKRYEDSQTLYYKTLKENTLAKQDIAYMQKDLYCARKHTKKMTKDFVSILSKLLGVNQN
jgi:uncharacterized membrane-anchored protein YhcB (DUF1043 family)